MIVNNNFEFYKGENLVVQRLQEVLYVKYTQFSLDLNAYVENFLDSQEFIDIIYNSEIFPFTKLFEKEFFSNFNSVVLAFSSLGTENSIIYLIKGLLGQQTIVSINGLNINISNVSFSGRPLLDNIKQFFLSDNQGNPLLSIENRLNLDSYILQVLIKKLIPSIKVNIIFSE
jgi:hypothetical protein